MNAKTIASKTRTAAKHSVTLADPTPIIATDPALPSGINRCE